MFFDPLFFFVHLHPPGFEIINSEIICSILLAVMSYCPMEVVTVWTLHRRNNKIPFNPRFNPLFYIHDLFRRDPV